MNNIDKKYTDLIGDAYKNYFNEVSSNKNMNFDVPLSKEEFINKIKTDNEFAKKWGVNVEVRELSAKERIELAGGKIQEKYPALIEQALNVCDEREIPIRAISFTYNNEAIEIYE